MSRVYIAGPISGGLPGVSLEEKKQRFFEAETKLVAEGHGVVNPLNVHVDTCPGNCNPEQHIGQEGVATHSWVCFMRHDLLAMLKCDTIAMLPGWETSKGACLELYIAEALSMRVIYLV